MKRFLPFILILIVALAAAAGGNAIYRTKKSALAAIARPKPVEGEKVEAGAEPPHSWGKEGKAEVVIEEFGDFQCPPCRGMAEALDKVQQEYGTRLFIIFRQFPLPMHQYALPAAYVAEAAAVQNRFWDMHHLLYDNQAEWSEASDPQPMFEKYAEKAHLDIKRLREDLGSEKVRNRVQADQDRGKSLGVTGTPTLFINDERAPFNQIASPELLHRAVEMALSGKKPIFEPDKE